MGPTFARFESDGLFILGISEISGVQCENSRAIDQNFGPRVLNNLKFRLQTCLEIYGGYIEQIL